LKNNPSPPAKIKPPNSFLSKIFHPAEIKFLIASNEKAFL
jgi:hypothetical protein